jgi:mono/diheme cytochrome c family protein
MMHLRISRLLMPVLLALLLVACGASREMGGAGFPSSAPMMGPGSGMMARHHAPIPDDYAGMTNPIDAEELSLARGRETYALHCATCHGDQGLGDGPTAAGLEPAPVPLAFTARMLADDYLFWRISEGGAMEPFNSAMPAWKGVLDEETRWDVVNALRDLSGQPAPGPADREAEAARRGDMLAQALEQELITREEALLFDQIHARIDELLARRETAGMGMMVPDQTNILDQLVAQGIFSEQQVQMFNDVHDRLLAAGLMD